MKEKYRILIYVVFIFCIMFLGCTINIKTPIVADYKKLEEIDATKLDKTQVELLLGTPQGKGVQMYEGKKYDLYFYTGFIGEASSGEARLDSGTVFVTFDNDKCVHLLYRLASIAKTIRLNQPLPIDKFFDNILIGKSTVNDVLNVLGEPTYQGRRVNLLGNVTHKILWYDSSKLEKTDGAMIEKWMMLGYDNNGVIQDVMWVSSVQDDIKDLGKAQSNEAKILYGTLGATGMSTERVIDPMQVDALLKTSPQNVSEIENIMGPPSAVGVRLVKETDALIMSSWTHVKLKVLGREQLYRAAVQASKEAAPAAKEPESYVVMDVKQSMLIVWHNSKGNIKEYFWFRPI